MTANNPETKQLVQVSEHFFDPIQVPVQVGEEIYIVIQQDVRRIQDTRNLTYFKYRPELNQTQLFQQNQCNPTVSNCQQKFLNEEHLWDNITTALLITRSLESNPHKVELINQLLNSLEKNKKYIAPIENQMEWEYNIPKCNNQIQDNLKSKKRVRFIKNLCCKCNQPPTVYVRNRGTETCQFIDIGNLHLIESECEPSNVREQLLQKKKTEDIFSC